MRVLLLHNGIRQPDWLKRSLRYQHIEAIMRDPAKPETNEKRLSENEIESPGIAGIIAYIHTATHERITDEARKIKRKDQTLPLVILNENPLIQVHMAEADIHFDAPFNFKHIAVVIKRLAYEKSAPSAARVLKAADLYLDPDNRVARRNGHDMPLRNKEFALLEFLMMNRGKILTRDVILEHVWDRNNNLLSNTVDVHMNSLRRKLERISRKPVIHTIHCVGYKFEPV